MRVAVTLEQCWHRVPGGTARAALDLVAALQQLPEAPDLVGVSAFHRGAPAPGYEPTIPVRQLKLGRRPLYEAWHRLRWPAIESATGVVDVLHATGLAVPPRRAPLVWTLHDLAFIREPGHFTSHGLRFFHAALERALATADVVLCSSEATRRDALAAGFEPGRLRVVPLGARQQRATEEQVERVAAEYSLNRPYVLHVGTAEPRKNLERLVMAFEAMGRNDVDLVLVGPQGWGPSISASIAKLGERARLLGFVPSEHLGPLYAGAAVFCYPSLWEGFGLPVLEALVQGAPTVTSAGTATEEVAGDAALLVDPRDTSAITAALREVLDNPALADRLRHAGPSRASNFTWDSTARQTAEIYSGLTGGN